MSATKTAHEPEISTSRLEAFSDGVFAIAITLLILEIKIPGEEVLQRTSLPVYILKQWPEFFAYVFSFVIIGIYWANHHYIFKLYRRTDHTFNMLNVFFLMTIAFLPYPTAILGEYVMDESHRRTATIFYAIGIYLPALMWLVLWLYASKNKRLIDKTLKESFIKHLAKQFWITNALYILAIALAFFSPVASIILNVLLTLLYMSGPKKPEYEE